MAENREEILNELIKYYDGETPSETPEEKKAAEAEDLGNTRIVGQTDTATVNSAQAMGDTVVVNVKRAVDEDVTQPPKPVYEEVLGNLGIDGKPVTGQIETPRETFRKEEEARKKTETKRIVKEEAEHEDEREDRDGIWYSLKPLWVTLILCMVVFLGIGFYATDTGIIGTYKRNFEYNMSVIFDLFGIDFDSDEGEMPVVGENGELIVADNSSAGSAAGFANADGDLASVEYVADEKVSVMIPFDEADSSDFSVYDNGVVCVKSNYICFINKNGQTEWEEETSVINPMVKSAGEYIAVAADGGTRFELYKDRELCYGIDAPDLIRTFDVSERGDVALSIEKKAYKGAVTVFNKKGEQIFSWGSGVNYITDVQMLKTRQVAVSLVNSDRVVVSYVMMFDVKYPEPVSGVKLENTLVFDVENVGNDILISGDNTIAEMSDYSEINYDIRFDEVLLLHSSQDMYRNRAVSFTADNEPVISVYNKYGEVEYEAVTDIIADNIDIYKNTVVYSNGRTAFCERCDDGERISYTAPTEVKKILLMSETTCLFVYEDNLEIIKWY